MGTIRQTVMFAGVTPRMLYDAFLDSRTHSAMTGGRARMSGRVGGTWSAWNGDLSGKNVELVAGKRIVQTWRGGDFPEDHHSTLTLTFARSTTGARVTLRQTDVPDDLAAGYAQGWRDYYWTPMKAYFEGRRKTASRRAR